MTQRSFKQVDVFTDTPYYGNPLAVVLDGSGLSGEEMQHFAAWTHLSETTFILPPTPQGKAAGAHYQVRIFTPTGELPFAGHPTLGTCHAWLQTQPTAKHAPDAVLVQECKLGLIHIRREGTRLAFAAPPLKRSNASPTTLARVATALGLKADQIVAAQMLDNGPVWLGLLLDSRQTVLRLTPDHLTLKNLGLNVGVASIETAQAAPVLIARSSREARAFTVNSTTANRSEVDAHADTPEVEIEVRAFAAPIGVNEDPVTGSFNAALAQWLIADQHAPAHYVASQGSCVGRAGRVHIAQDPTGQVWVGGDCVTCIDGSVAL